MNNAPDEILFYIFNCLPLYNLFILLSVSKRFSRVASIILKTKKRLILGNTFRPNDDVQLGNLQRTNDMIFDVVHDDDRKKIWMSVFREIVMRDSAIQFLVISQSFARNNCFYVEMIVYYNKKTLRHLYIEGCFLAHIFSCKNLRTLTCNMDAVAPGSLRRRFPQLEYIREFFRLPTSFEAESEYETHELDWDINKPALWGLVTFSRKKLS